MLGWAIGLVTFFVIAGTILLRLIYPFPRNENQRASPKKNTSDTECPVRLAIVLGSGGHTAEMFTILETLDITKYAHRSYIVSSGDAFSAQKARDFENQVDQRHARSFGAFDIGVVPRARNIHQSILTTPFSSLLCLWSCTSTLRKPELARQRMAYPHVIITNGPGTAVIVILSAYLLRLTAGSSAQGKMRSIYVESVARVKRLSLSGKIMLHLVNRFIVQWEGLTKSTGGKAEYLGVLV